MTHTKEELGVAILRNIYIKGHGFWAGRYHQKQIKIPSPNTTHSKKN